MSPDSLSAPKIVADGGLVGRVVKAFARPMEKLYDVWTRFRRALDVDKRRPNSLPASSRSAILPPDVRDRDDLSAGVETSFSELRGSYA